MRRPAIWLCLVLCSNVVVGSLNGSSTGSPAVSSRRAAVTQGVPAGTTLGEGANCTRLESELIDACVGSRATRPSDTCSAARALWRTLFIVLLGFNCLAAVALQWHRVVPRVHARTMPECTLAIVDDDDFDLISE